MLKALKVKLFNFLLRHVYNMTTEEDVLTVHFTDAVKKLGYILLNGERMDEGSQRELVADAKAMLRLGGRMRIKKAICADATEKLVIKSQTIDDMVAGKIMLYTMDIEEKLLEKIATLSQ